MASGPSSAPPVIRAACAPMRTRSIAARRIAARSLTSSRPSRISASRRLGVTSAASGNMCSRIAATAPGASSKSPLAATITGSTTTLGILRSRTRCATASITSSRASIPVLAAATGKSSITASICAAINAGSRSATERTPAVFCAVSAVLPLAPQTPNALKVLRSAWMPAPPEESEPAIVSATLSINPIRRTTGRSDAILLQRLHELDRQAIGILGIKAAQGRAHLVDGRGDPDVAAGPDLGILRVHVGHVKGNVRAADVVLPELERLAGRIVLDKLKQERAGSKMYHFHPRGSPGLAILSFDDRAFVHPRHVAVKGQRTLQVADGKSKMR